MSDSPWFSFYASDFMAGTIDMSPMEVAAYVRLMCYQWDKGPIPVGDTRKMVQVTGLMPDELDGVMPMIMSKFPDGLNARLEKERDKRELQRLKGKKGGEAKAKSSRTPSRTPSRKLAEPLAESYPKPSQTPSQTPAKKLALQPQPQYTATTTSRERERKESHTHAEFSEMGIPAQLEEAKRRLATVRAGWQVEFDAVEREALITQAHLKTISELDDETWATMAEMLSASKKIADRREKLKIGLPKRSTFVCNIGDWIANAEHYRSHHPLPKPKAPPPESPKVIEMTDEEREHARRELKSALR